MKTVIYPPSVQSDLFDYLKVEQQEFVRPILRVLKKPMQEEWCCMLLDYLETGCVDFSGNLVLDSMFSYVTRFGMERFDNPSDPRIIRPLRRLNPAD